MKKNLRAKGYSTTSLALEIMQSVADVYDWEGM
jgi:hypothetical protein